MYSQNVRPPPLPTLQTDDATAEVAELDARLKKELGAPGQKKGPLWRRPAALKKVALSLRASLEVLPLSEEQRQVLSGLLKSSSRGRITRRDVQLLVESVAMLVSLGKEDVGPLRAAL